MNPDFPLPDYRFMRCEFEVLKPITRVPHFQGIHWSSLFRYAYNPVLRKGEPFHQVGLLPTPADSGVESYAPGDRIELGLAFPAPEEARLKHVFSKLEKTPGQHGTFEVGNTIRCLQNRCRVSDTLWSQSPLAPLTQDHLQPAWETLCAAETLELTFSSPLRLKASRLLPANDPHRVKYLNEYVLQTVPEAWPHLHHAIWKAFETSTGNGETELPPTALVLDAAQGMWMDLRYGRQSQAWEKTLGGFVGTLRLSGSMSPDWAWALLWQQWLGLGKNRAFGLGQYQIAHLGDANPLLPLVKHASLFNEVVSVSSLERTLYDLKDTSPGPNGLTVQAFRALGKDAVHHLVDQIRVDRYQMGEMQPYQIPKKGGDFRTIHVPNVQDRLLQSQAARVLSPVVNRLLSDACFAYREGFSREQAIKRYFHEYRQGYRYGLKADIEAFFESVDRTRLLALLRGLFPQEPLIDLLEQWLTADPTVPGLPQGNPLSPVLSNLFLDQFDRELQALGWKLIRYGDDFLVLFQLPEHYGPVLSWLETRLAVLGLTLAADKTTFFAPTYPITFLGYHLLAGEEVLPEWEELPLTQESEWLPLFDKDWTLGKMVYVTSAVRKVTTEHNTLVLEDARQQRTTLPWNTIGGITVIGRSRINGGVFYRALQERVPVFFQYLNGAPYGQLSPEKQRHASNITALQHETFGHPDTCLEWAKAVVLAKEYNRQTLLRRHQVKRRLTLDQIRKRLKTCTSLEELRGIEGAWARQYFEVFGLLTSPFPFEGREYHPPKGPVNAMLSLGYTLLYHRMNAALLRVGLDTRMGFYHQGRGTHAALASDLMEELRYLVERLVLSLIHLKVIRLEHFKTEPEVPYPQLVDEGFRLFIQRFEKTMQTPFQAKGAKHPISYNAYLDEIAEKAGAAIRLGVTYPPRLAR